MTRDCPLKYQLATIRSSYGSAPQSPIALVGRARHPRRHARSSRRHRHRRRRDLGHQLRRHPRRPRPLPSPAVRGAAVLPRRARAPLRAASRRARAVRDRGRRLPLRRPVLAAVHRHGPGHAGRARLAGAATPGRVHRRARGAAARRAAAPGPARRRPARAGRDRPHRRRPRVGRPARRAGADDRRRVLVGPRQRRHPQGAVAEPARAARVVEPRPAASAALAQPADRARRGRLARPDRRARAALRRRALDPARLRRLGLAAGPAPGLRPSRRSRCWCRSSGIAAAWIALGEVPSGTELAGAAVVLGGLALHRRLDRHPGAR